MPVFVEESIEEPPYMTLERWRIIETSQKKIYFVGYNVEHGAGQISPPIHFFDPRPRRGITRSGHIYALSGDSGFDPDAERVLAIWAARKGLDMSEITDISDQVFPNRHWT